MNQPNPFIPQGSLLEQKNRKRTRFQIAVFVIFAVNILVLTPMLIEGCKRESQEASNITPPMDTGATIAADTNPPPVPPPPMTSNPAPAPLPPQSLPSATEYVIVRGDTLDSIHKKFGVSVKAIEDANPGIVPTKLQPGHKLQIPAPMAAANNATVATDGSELYVVKAGDNLSTIARNHGTTAKAIEALNNLKTTKIKVGDKLKLPPAKVMASNPPPVDTLAAPPPPVVPGPTAPAPVKQ